MISCRTGLGACAASVVISPPLGIERPQENPMRIRIDRRQSRRRIPIDFKVIFKLLHREDDFDALAKHATENALKLRNFSAASNASVIGGGPQKCGTDL